MISRLRLALLRYLNENFDDLLALDLKWARILGAPAPHTISSYAWKLEQENKLWGKLWRPMIDWIFKWLLEQEDHCYKDFKRITGS